MGILFDAAKQIEPWLEERGLRKAAIQQGMNILLGGDWEGISQKELFKRLAVKKYSVSDELPDFADEMEGLVRGAVAMDRIRRKLNCDFDDKQCLK